MAGSGQDPAFVLQQAAAAQAQAVAAQAAATAAGIQVTGGGGVAPPVVQGVAAPPAAPPGVDVQQQMLYLMQQMAQQQQTMQQQQNAWQTAFDGQNRQIANLIASNTKASSSRDERTTRNIMEKLGKPDFFTPGKTDFQSWDFHFLGYLGTASPTLRMCAETSKRATSTIPLPSDAAELEDCRLLYFALSQLLKGASLKLVRQVEEDNGREAYRLFASRYGSRDYSGALAILQNIITYKFPTEIEKFEESLSDFILMVHEYDEHPETTVLDTDTKKAVLLANSPEPLKTHLQLNATTLSWEDILTQIESYLRTKRVCILHKTKPRDPNAMEVDAVWKGKKGGKKGKKGHDKSGKDGGGKGDQHTSAPFEGECNWCGHWGHRKADCRKYKRSLETGNNEYTPKGKKGKKGHGKKGSKNKQHLYGIEHSGGDEWNWTDPGDWQDGGGGKGPEVTGTPTEAVPKTSAAAVWRVAPPPPTSSDIQFAKNKFIFGIEKPIPEIEAIEFDYRHGHNIGRFKFCKLMVDSGAYTHVCPPWFAPHCPCTRNGETITAEIASEESLVHLGEKRVAGYGKNDKNQWIYGEITFQVHNIKRPMISTTELSRKGGITPIADVSSNIVMGPNRFMLDLHGDHGWFPFG